MEFQKGTKATGNENLSNYYLSEKLDGLRASWDGYSFVSRGGIKFPAPSNFKVNMPSSAEIVRLGGPLDGELYIDRGCFQKTSGIIRGEGNDWVRSGVRFHIFDMMSQGEVFSRRHQLLREYIPRFHGAPYTIVDQTDLALWGIEWPELLNHIRYLSKEGAEGGMLALKNGIYQSGRNKNILKLKIPDYGWCKVIGYSDGKGKYAGEVGAYNVVGTKGQVKGENFSIGSGLSDWQRTNPMAKGSLMPFRHWGTFNSGKPRQPVFVDVDELPKGVEGP